MNIGNRSINNVVFSTAESPLYPTRERLEELAIPTTSALSLEKKHVSLQTNAISLGLSIRTE